MNDLERTIAESGVENRVQRIGFVDDAALTGLYSGADAVVIPSLYEGFGLPVLEAMACGAPVVTSNVSSMLEVAGNAAVLVDPTRLESIVDGLRDVLLSAEVQTRLRVAGPVRAAEFTWDRTAQLTLSAYRSIAS